VRIPTPFTTRRKQAPFAISHLWSALGGAAAGCAAAYWLDPQLGAHRREAVRRRLRAAPSTLTQRMAGHGEDVRPAPRQGAAVHTIDTIDGRRAWGPWQRLLAGAAGVSLLNYSLGQRTAPSAAAGLAGLALLTRSASSASLPRVEHTRRRSGTRSFGGEDRAIEGEAAQVESESRAGVDPELLIATGTLESTSGIAELQSTTSLRTELDGDDDYFEDDDYEGDR
jgi:hypothetical protein